MNHRGLIRAGALVVVLLMLIGGLAALPYWNARAQGKTVWGYVVDCDDPFQLWPTDGTPLVSLVDAHTGEVTAAQATNEAGFFSFEPAAGNYFLRATVAGYFANATDPFRFDGTDNLQTNLCLVAHPDPTISYTVHVQDSVNMAAIENATVVLWNTTFDQMVDQGLTNATGNVTFSTWSGDVEVRVNKSGFATEIVPDSLVNPTESITVTLTEGFRIQGPVNGPDGAKASDGLVATLFNLNEALPLSERILRAEIVDNVFIFRVKNGTYRLIVDADGFAATRMDITVAGTEQFVPVVLQPSAPETIRTEIAYVNDTWNALAVVRNVTLNADSFVPTLPYAFVRDLELQLDLAFGSVKNGTLDAADMAAAETWFQGNGPFYVTTDALLSTNGKAYLSNETSFSLALSRDGSLWRLNASVSYELKDPSNPLPASADTYFVNVTGLPDVQAETYRDYTFSVVLPKGYERTTFTSTGDVSVSGYTTVTVDPGPGAGTPQANLVVERSLAGTARARIVEPAGRFSERDASVDNYTAYVAGNTNITFSAEESSDPVGDIAAANFTWRFTNGTVPDDVAYGIRATFNYTVEGEFTVNLTVTETGGNKTYRDLRVTVDLTPPVAVIWTNVTAGVANQNGTAITVEEDVPIRFGGNNSADKVLSTETVGNETGEIRSWNWDFDGDGTVDATNRISDFAFPDPGTYNVTLWVTDLVGQRSANATLNVTVVDRSGPDIQLQILEDGSWKDVSTGVLEEDKTYWFNATGTEDNADPLANLSFVWDFGDDTETVEGTGAAFANVSHVFTRFSEPTFALNLTVADTKGNDNSLVRDVTVQIRQAKYPDLNLDPTSYALLTEAPEEFQPVVFTINVTNKEDRAAALSLNVRLVLIQETEETDVPFTVRWLDANGTETAAEIAPGETKVLEVTWVPDSAGNRSLRLEVNDTFEPGPWDLPENEHRFSVPVREAWWRPFLIGGIILFLIVGIPLIIYAVRRLRARGVTMPRLRRRGEGKEGKKRL
jgi:PKD repeat protein